MATIKPESLVALKNAAFELGDVTGDNFAAVCNQIRLEPTGSSTTFEGMTPDGVWTAPGSWQLTLGFADDYESADSLWNYLYDNDGKSVPIRFWPDITGQGFEGTVAIVAAGIGGTARQFAQSTVTLTLAGKPSRTAGSYPTA